VRERLLLGLGLVGAAMVFFAVAVRRSGSRSTPCSICGRIEDLAFVDPIGTHLIRAILWDCQCGSTRAVPINRYTPSALIEKALARDMGSHQPWTPPGEGGWTTGNTWPAPGDRPTRSSCKNPPGVSNELFPHITMSAVSIAPATIKRGNTTARYYSSESPSRWATGRQS